MKQIKLCVGIVLPVLAGRLLAFVVLDQCFGQLAFVIFYDNIMQHEPCSSLIASTAATLAAGTCARR